MMFRSHQDSVKIGYNDLDFLFVSNRSKGKCDFSYGSVEFYNQ